MTEARWVALVVDVPAAVEDEVAGLLGSESLGVESQPLPSERVRLRIYVGSEADALALAARSDSERDALGVAATDWQARFEPVEDLRWAERYQASLRPFPIGSRFLVIPSETTSAATGREPLHLVPGMAFGTGEHPTTRLCVEELERRVAPGSRWLDLGCGTGILALVARRCGASDVLAVDDDPEAVAVAREVVEANEATNVSVAVGSARENAGARFDGVVANIALEFFAAHASDVAALLRDGGTAIVAGFLAADAAEIERILAAAGLAREELRSSDGWGVLVARRAGPR